MKKTAWILAAIGIMFISRAHGQTPFTITNVVAAAAEATQTEPLPAGEVPTVGMFYSAQNLNAPPAPGNFAGLSSWALGNGCYLLDDLEGDIPSGDRSKDDGGGPPGPGDGGTNYSGGGSTNSPFLVWWIVAGPIVLSPLVVAESLGVKRYGSLMGLVGFPFTLGLAIGPLAAGAIYDLTASYARAFELCAVIAIVGVAASLLCVPAEWERLPMAAPDAATIDAAAHGAAAPQH